MKQKLALNSLNKESSDIPIRIEEQTPHRNFRNFLNTYFQPSCPVEAAHSNVATLARARMAEAQEVPCNKWGVRSARNKPEAQYKPEAQASVSVSREMLTRLRFVHVIGQHQNLRFDLLINLDLVSSEKQLHLIRRDRLGDGNDIALYADSIPVELGVNAMTITRGIHAAGSASDLSTSNNVDVSVRRSNTDILLRTEITVHSVCPHANPTRLELRLERSDIQSDDGVNETRCVALVDLLPNTKSMINYFDRWCAQERSLPTDHWDERWGRDGGKGGAMMGKGGALTQINNWQ